MNKTNARNLLRHFNFKDLFLNELGWDDHDGTLTLNVGGDTVFLTAVAEKRGMAAYICPMPSPGKNYDYQTRCRIEIQLAKSVREHLVIYTDADCRYQTWQWVKREPGRPIARREHTYTIGQSGEALLQKLKALEVNIEEDENLTLVGIAAQVRKAFDVDRLTKAFYCDFDTSRKNFLKFIDGIVEVADREWYTSVMLNRLMFIYFIQRKGFLDSDPNYLRNRLDRCKKEQGKDKFYTFYRYFLLRLFHEGFGKRRMDRAPDLEKLLGNIPYLNGGLFDVHELEKPERYGKNIQIPDKAFERIFDYFDKYQWHLDERPLRADNEINPDVLGYIFEKYINQKQMGAYYTKEDITEHISKNTVIPFLFDAARANCKVAFENPDAPTVWDLLHENPDSYIYPALRHGVTWNYIAEHQNKGEPLAKPHSLPSEIAAGIDTTKPNLFKYRKGWDKAAPAEYALPTETWREVIARRQRYKEVRKKLAAGEVRDISDFTTLNLDLRQFAQDVIQNCEGPDLLMAFWQAITTISVLDPTGGSGAFIFAALNILEPLYEACLDRMEAFLAEWGEAGKIHHPNYYKKFTEVLSRVDAHPNRPYFVLKSIILNNLYAVDIMEEAVEICKLRLFLKLAAQVDPDAGRDNLGIEPLPDIDFNIRAGNTLVGYATYEEVKRAITSKLDFDNAMEKIAVKFADLQQKFDKFRQIQTEGDGSVPAADKLDLQKRLKALEDELNHYLAGEYGVKVSDKVAYAKWVKSHQPFHWFIQFYGIINSGGFNVIIGNPPYLEVSKLKESYNIRGFETAKTGNLYALCTERSFNLLHEHSYISLIVPLSMFATPNMIPIQQVVRRISDEIWVSYYSNRPDQLFEGAQNFLSIFTARKRGAKQTTPTLLHTTKLYRWASEERDKLFQLHSFVTIDSGLDLPAYAYPKFSDQLETSIARKLFRSGVKLSELCRDTGPNRSWFVYCYGGVYWTKARNFNSPVLKDGVKAESTADRPAYTISELDPLAAICLLNSNMHFWFWVNFSDCRNKTYSVILDIPVVRDRLIVATDLLELGRALMLDYRANAERRVRDGKGGRTEFDEFYPKQSKTILDKIDKVLAKHYGFTEEELDFIINYDIKYRMGLGKNGVDSEDE